MFTNVIPAKARGSYICKGLNILGYNYTKFNVLVASEFSGNIFLCQEMLDIRNKKRIVARIEFGFLNSTIKMSILYVHP